MTINLNDYRAANAEYIKNWLKNKPNCELFEECSKIAVALNLPIIVTYHFVGEATGFTDELKKRIESNMKFYHVDKIEGIL